MLCKTIAIVLKTIKYSETSLVVKAYTADYGLRSFLVRSVRKKHAKNSPNLFQPLSLLEIVFIDKEGSGLIIPKDIASWQHFSSIPFDVYKSSVVLFMNELIYRSVHEEEANPAFFQFLLKSLIYIDGTQNRVSNAHLVFALQLTRFLGFFPFGNFSPSQPYFLLREGVFSKFAPEDELSLSQEESQWFDRLSLTGLENCHELEISNATRSRLLEVIILYYQLHLIGFGDIKSLDVLNQVFHS
jgi:DNA repair protein RecO (recombination protein O)